MLGSQVAGFWGQSIILGSELVFIIQKTSGNNSFSKALYNFRILLDTEVELNL